MTAVHAEQALVDGRVLREVRIEVDEAGLIAAISSSATSADLHLGTVLAGAGNAHSHAFHRLLRGRTHDRGGDFWRWREQMYAAAARLTPGDYERLAEAVFAEMLVSGWTSVAEFHYLHHRPDGTPYADPDGFGPALVRAAASVGIRLTLLDTLYLTSAPGRPLRTEQLRFGDADVEAWLARRQRLAETTGGAARGQVRVGAAIHSVRAASPDDIAVAAERLPDDVPLHVHVSEQPAENEQCLVAYGLTPTAVLARAGALSPRTWLVHATHITDADLALIAGSGAGVVMCPTTEADLGDGIGPARELADAGVRIALGSDQNAVVDPWLETRALEHHERLRSRRRGCFSPAELDTIRSSTAFSGATGGGGLTVGAPADLVEIDHESVRTAGCPLDQLALAATAADVGRVLVGGRVVADHGRLADGRDPTALLRAGLRAGPRTELPR